MAFRLGINYWPVSSAMYWWRRCDAAEVAQDFARIRAAGFDTVRLFLRWEDFQPAPERVAPAMLTHLVTMADIAAHNALALMPRRNRGGVVHTPSPCRFVPVRVFGRHALVLW